MLFITNRKMDQTDQLFAPFHTDIDFDLKNNDPSNNLIYGHCDSTLQPHSEEYYTKIGSLAFMQRLKDCRAKHILFFIHGYNNMPEDAFKTALELQRMFDIQEEGLIEIVPIIWPCDNDLGLIKDYWDDQMTADASGVGLSRIFCKLEKWQKESETLCRKRMYILAHSMGNRVLRSTLQAWQKYFVPQGLSIVFRSIFLVAADVDNQTLEEGRPGHIISECAKHVIVCYAPDDEALKCSKALNLRGKRLGDTGMKHWEKKPYNVSQIDCDDYNDLYDKIGHTYFLGDKQGAPGEVCKAIFKTIQTGRTDSYIID